MKVRRLRLPAGSGVAPVPVRTTSIALSTGLLTSWVKLTSTVPSLVTVTLRIVPVWSPAAAAMSYADSTCVPSTDTSNVRLPAPCVALARLAK